MYFNTIEYLFFLPLVCFLYYFSPAKFRWVILFIASCTFYMWFVPEYILCLFFLILVDFFLAKKIDATEVLKKRRFYLILSLLSNFGLLFYFKYYNFLISNVNLITEPAFGFELSLRKDILPIGLSFHTFQSISYIIDVFKKKQKPETHLGIYSNYVLFFPQMVAGPIERYSTLGQQLNNTLSFNINMLKKAIQLILVGLFYKMVIADNCGAYVNGIYDNLNTSNGFNVFIAILLFSVQIYADFFGYSLIAQGSAGLFGINLIDNFKFPFFSENMIEFWKRWHISLTSWFRNYLYFPLGGSKDGKLKHVRNIIIIFSLSGLWHGASWNFVLWGVLHSIFYLLVYFLKQVSLNFIPIFLKYLFTFVLVACIFVFFRSPTFSHSISVFSSLANLSNIFTLNYTTSILMLLIAFTFFIEFFAKRKENYFDFLTSMSGTLKTVILLIMIFCIMTFSGIDNLPFIYFQF